MLRAGPVRLRPVLMTAVSTIGGMLPVALSQSQGSEFRAPMGVLAIGGMLSSTLLTLVVVPVVYTLVDDLGTLPARLRARTARRLPRSAELADAPVPRSEVG